MKLSLAFFHNNKPLSATTKRGSRINSQKARSILGRLELLQKIIPGIGMLGT